MSTKNPHDGLFKDVFSQPEHAGPELRAVLPARLASAIEWSTLALRPGSFVDADLRPQYTDLLFSARAAGAEILIYTLFEHQSTAVRMMPFRLLKYEVRIWDDYLRENPHTRTLPLIVPVVLHHSETGWKYDTRFEALLDMNEELAAAAGEHAVRFRFALDDVSLATDEELRARAISKLGMLVLGCFRHARDVRTFLTNIGRWTHVVRDVYEAPNGPRAIALIFRYIFETGADLSVDEVQKLLAGAVDRKVEEEVVTLAEKLIEEGRKEGERRALHQTLLKLLRQRFGEPPPATVERVGSAKEAELEHWIDRVLTAPSLDLVFAET